MVSILDQIEDLLVNANFLHLRNQNLQKPHDRLQWQLRLPGGHLKFGKKRFCKKLCFKRFKHKNRLSKTCRKLEISI